MKSMHSISVVPALAWLASAMLIPTPNLHADDEPPPKVLARQLKTSQGTVHDAILPGIALDVAPYPGGGVAVLVIPEDAVEDAEDAELEAPRALYRIRGHENDTRPVAVGLPAKLDAMVARSTDLWMGDDERLYRWPADSRSASDLKPLLDVEGLSLAVLKRRGLIAEDSEILPIPEVGSIGRYTEMPTGLELVDRVDLPVRARRRAGGFELWSPSLIPVEEGGKPSNAAWGTTTEALGAQRIGALLIDSSAPEGERVQENWFLFNAPEDVQQHRWVRIDGRTALIVATTPGDKLGIFQKLKVRIFYAGADRTRAGRRPTMSLETVTRRWYSIDPHVYDVTLDGKDDLVLIQPEGMGAGDLVVDVLPGKGNGRFDERGRRRTKLKDHSGYWYFGEDFNGDGRPDLATTAEGRLSLYALETKSKRKALKKEPFFTLDRDTETRGSTQVTVTVAAGTDGTDVESISARGRIRVFDADNDDRPDLVLMRSVRGRAVIRVVSLAL